ncbi:hypothetical protein [Actinomadura sp. NEAU-AAG7]|nr:hypothetical protein [Actinomadura sp. NEAU-AAG7]MBT2213477.1 hypothetical protein [Actinomadura sp. NEAU-AAG7]
MSLTDVVEHIDITSGAYRPALDDWAALTRPAPAPTRPGQGDQASPRPA